jgi:D-alanyl-D-alanine carboxypeptidase (penicillin-binding protein 5/6)
MLTAVTLIPKLDPHGSFAATYTDATVDGTRVGLVPDFKYTISKLFTCMLVDSANDAADALAQANGGIHKTVNEMNAKAHVLQADDTFARTPSGLDGPGETTSAYDLALIAKAGLAMPDFRKYIGTIRARVPAPHHQHYMIYTHNELLTTYRGDIGVKNGYTVAAQGTDVNAATRHGQTIVVTLMHAYPNFWPMAKDLLNWGFKANGKVTPVGNLVSPLLPPGPKSTAAATSHHVLSSSALPGTKHHKIPWLVLEIVVVVLFLGSVFVTLNNRRHRRRNRYRSRLRLPPM